MSSGVIPNIPPLAALKRHINRQHTVLDRKYMFDFVLAVYNGVSRCIILVLGLMNVESLFRSQNWAKQSDKLGRA